MPKVPIGSVAAPPRARRAEDGDVARPIYVVWEVTLHCDQPCTHCGSRAGRPRSAELSTQEAFDVVDALKRLGMREVVLIGGEAYLRNDIYDIVHRLADGDIRVAMQTGGRGLTAERVSKLAAAGLTAVGVSIDGPAPIHDRLRGNEGSHAAALRALDHARDAGLIVTSNIQINRANAEHLRETADTIRQHGVVSWQVALTVPMGHAADRPDYILEPWRVVDVIDTLADIQLQAAEQYQGGHPFIVYCGNNLGYYGPHEQTLRSRPGGNDVVWMGCQAGFSTMGIESDGTIKPCPSLPTAPYVGGNVRDASLEAIWEQGEAMRFVRDRDLEELWGFCKSCYFAEHCRAGCSWMAHCTLGRRGNNPFCYHRVTELKKQGVRERLELRDDAPGEPYDFGRYEIVSEPWDAQKRSRRLPIL